MGLYANALDLSKSYEVSWDHVLKDENSNAFTWYTGLTAANNPYESEVADLLEVAAQNATGVIAKGIEAIRLQAEGYSCKEIGERYGASDNNVTAWISRARRYLQKDAITAALVI